MKWRNISDRETNGIGITHLSDEQVQKIHGASLEILDSIGVQVHLEEAVDLLKKAGAKVTDGNLVHLPPKLVESALSTVPKEVTLYDRNGNPVMPLGGARCFFGPGSDCLNIIDHRTGERREPVLQDVIDGALFVMLCPILILSCRWSCQQMWICLWRIPIRLKQFLIIQ